MAAASLSSGAFAQDMSLPEWVQQETFTFAKKDGSELKFDLYRAKGDIEKRPTIICSFGGGWAGGDRFAYKMLAPRFIEKGINAVCVDYRLELKGKDMADSTLFGPQFNHAISFAVADLYDATRYLLDHQDSMGVDPDKVLLIGGSAGATNSTMAEYWLCNEEPIATARLPKGFNYAAVIPCAGGVWKNGLEKPVWKNKPCPHMWYHGTMDWTVPFWVVTMPACNYSAYGPSSLVEIFKENGYPYEAFFLDQADHMMAAAPLFGNFDFTEHMFDFIDRVIFGKQPLQIDYFEKDYDDPHSFLVMLQKLAATKGEGGDNLLALASELDQKKENEPEKAATLIPQQAKGDIRTESVKVAGATLTITRDASFEGPRPVFVCNGQSDADFSKMVAKGYVTVSLNASAKSLRGIVKYIKANAAKWNADPDKVVAAGTGAMSLSDGKSCAGVITFDQTPASLNVPILAFRSSASDDAAWDAVEAAKGNFILYTVPEATLKGRERIAIAFIERMIVNTEGPLAARVVEKSL